MEGLNLLCRSATPCGPLPDQLKKNGQLDNLFYGDGYSCESGHQLSLRMSVVKNAEALSAEILRPLQRTLTLNAH